MCVCVSDCQSVSGLWMPDETLLRQKFQLEGTDNEYTVSRFALFVFVDETLCAADVESLWSPVSDC